MKNSNGNGSELTIVYMGTPDFAVRPLQAMAEAGYHIPLVVAQPDKPNGRGKKLRPGAVKKAAEELGIPVKQPLKVRNNPEFLEELRALQPDLMVVAAYGKILPPELLAVPKLGCVNIHGSLLPRFRGAAPVQRCIMEGDEQTGVTLMYMAEGMDTGDMIASEKTGVGRKNAGELLEELSALGAELLLRWLPEFEKGKVPGTPQKEEEATYAPMLEKAEGRIDFSRPAAEIERKIRGFSPNPGAFTELNGERMKIHFADVVQGGKPGEPGTILEAGNDGILTVCGEDLLLIKQIQMPGKRAMPAADFLRGHRIEPGTVLG
ncbi:MAG: methionyl-tRNA formyltransferase [Firmicutes bacterium]|nr:methionyl-tRNA formyltransferase [Bacillota bacterium]